MKKTIQTLFQLHLLATRTHKKKRALPRTNQLQGIFSGQRSLLNYTCPRRVDEFWNLFQPGANQNRSHARKNIVKIALRKLFVGILCGGGGVGAAGVGGEVSEETIQTYLYSNCAFHHQI